MPKDSNEAKALTVMMVKGSKVVDAQLKGMEETVLGRTVLEQD